MKPSELSHFGLRRTPFSKEIEATELWLPSSKQSLVEEVVLAIEDRASVLLLGEPGVGKTCVLRAVRSRLPEAGFRLTYCHNVTLGRRDFYRSLCNALGVQSSQNAAGLFIGIEKHIQTLRRERAHPVFLLDEAHLLHPDMMAHLHILLNHEWDSQALLSLILVGLPELEGRMALRCNRSLLTRIHHRFLIEPATAEDTSEYLEFRLKAAGVENELFSRESVAVLHTASEGSLREIDRLATAALREAARRKRKLVDETTASRVAETLSTAI